MKLRNSYILLIILAMATLPFVVFAKGKQDIIFPERFPDTVNVMVYDTVYLYDTVFEYIEVRERVIVYDTVTIYQMPVIGRPDTLFFVPHDSSVLPIQPLMERYETEWSQTTDNLDGRVKTVKKNRHRDRWFSLDDQSGNNPVPFGYGVRTRSALEYHAESLFPQGIINTNDQEYGEHLSSRFYPELSWRHNLDYHYTHGKVQASAGVAYKQMNFVSYTDKSHFLVDTIFPWDHFQREVIVHDTTWFLDMDALLQGDTVWIPFVETNTVIVDDSVQVQKIDTTITQQRVKGRTQYVFLEMPVKFYYMILNKGRWESTAWGGLSAGILIKQSGPHYSPDTGTIPSPGSTIPATLQLKVLAGFRVDYHLSPITSLFFSAGYSASLNNFISGSLYNYRYNAISVGAGFKYQLFKNY